MRINTRRPDKKAPKEKLKPICIRHINRWAWKLRRLRTDRKARKDFITTAILTTLIVMMYAWLLYRLCTDPLEVGAAEIQDTYISEDITALVEEIAPRYNISVELIEAMIEKESSGNSRAVSASGRGYGLLQIHYSEHKDIMDSLDITDPEMLFDPALNIEAACIHLNDLREEYGDIFTALARYNGRTSPIKNQYVRKIVNRSYDLEEVHGLHNYEEDAADE